MPVGCDATVILQVFLNLLSKLQSYPVDLILGCAAQLNQRPSLCPQFQGARDPGDEQASSEPEEEEAHLRARGQQTASVAG